jgi:ketosteroid isomerase-like protein
MSVDREAAAGFVLRYGATWETWDVARFVELFSDDVVYIYHPTGETVVGASALRRYVEKEKAEQGAVSVRMGSPIIDGDRVAAEFWATGADATIAGCFIAQLNPADGKCTHFREYWFDIAGRTDPFDGWGT